MIANLSCPENISKLYVDKQETEGKKFFSFLIQKFCLDHYEHVRLKLLIPNNVYTWMSQWVSKRVAHLHIRVPAETCFYATLSCELRTSVPNQSSNAGHQTNFVNKIYLKISAEGLQTNDLRC